MLFSRLFYLFILLFAGQLCANQNSDTDAYFSAVYRVIESSDGQVYVITDNGTWQLANDALMKIESQPNLVVPFAEYQHLMPESLVGIGYQWQGWAGLGFTLAAILMIFGYIYYQQNLGYKQEVYLKKMQKQQQILDIAFWASGDEVLDCDLVHDKVTMLNQNSELELMPQVHFRSEAFIERLDPNDRSAFRSHFDAFLTSGDSNYELTYRIQSKTRGWLCLVERGCIIERDNQGKPLRLISCMRDVTLLQNEHDQLIKTIKELNKRLRLAEAELNQN